MIRTVKTACPLDCFDACGVVAEVDGDRIVRLRGDADHPFTRGALCKKVNGFLEDRQYSNERVTRPLRRTPAAAGGRSRGTRLWTWRPARSPRRASATGAAPFSSTAATGPSPRSSAS